MTIRTVIESSLGRSIESWLKAEDSSFDTYWHNPSEGLSVGMERVSGWADNDLSSLPRTRITLIAGDRREVLNDTASLSFIEDNGEILLSVTEE